MTIHVVIYYFHRPLRETGKQMTIYKSENGKAEILALYDRQLEKLMITEFLKKGAE